MLQFNVALEQGIDRLGRIAVALERLAAAHGAARPEDSPEYGPPLPAPASEIVIKDVLIDDPVPEKATELKTFTNEQLLTVTQPFKEAGAISSVKEVLTSLNVTGVSKLTECSQQNLFLDKMKQAIRVLPEPNATNVLNAINALKGS